MAAVEPDHVAGCVHFPSTCCVICWCHREGLIVSKSSANRARRERLEELRRQQRAQERRRTLIVTAICGLIVLAVVGATAFKLIQDKRSSDDLKNTQLADLGVAQAAAACSPERRTNGTGKGQHVDTPVKYDTTPPDHGAHWVQPADQGIHFYSASDRPEVERLVHNLEHGWTIVWYDDSAANDEKEMAALKKLAAVYDEHGTDPRYNLIVAPWTKADGKTFSTGKHVVFTHWSVGGDWKNSTKQNVKSTGVSVDCAKFSGAALAQFVDMYPYDDAPEGYLWHGN
jgi:Protein of unknown function (DUF3105)